MGRFSYLAGAAILFIVLAPYRAHAGEQLGPQALQQIQRLLEEKASRTPAQQKIASSLLFEIKKARRDATLEGLPELRSGLELDGDGRVLADLRAEVSGALLARIEDLDGVVVNHFERYDAIRARLPLGIVEELAADVAVRNVRPADAFMVQGNTVITEGDEAHRADQARANFGVLGTGVQVGTMSDSVDELALLQGTGELPPDVTVLPGQSGNPGASEGTALMEIIFDMAPEADLFFATGAGGLAQMATNIEDLEAAGCDVIVDDVLYFAEGVFQDDVIAQAVETVAGLGVLYASSAGNSGNLNDGTSGVYEGGYSGTALPPPLAGLGISAHDFLAPGGGNPGNTVTEDPLNDAPFFTLQWAEPLDAALTDYDLFLLDSTLTTILDASTDTQNGDDRPFEDIVSIGLDDTGNRLVVVKFAGDDLFFHLNTHRGRLEFATGGQIFGHPAASSAFAVAAVRVPAAGGPFTGNEMVEVFSSDGPRGIFFNADGSPAGLAGTGGNRRGLPMIPPVFRDKPDVTAADGVSTTSSNFPTFFGTSASAPHAAGIMALLIEGIDGLKRDALDGAGLPPFLTVPQLRGLFRVSSLDIEGLGFDNDSGDGILDADAAFDAPLIFADGFESGDVSAWN